ncbi:MAG: ABC transporter substrate-binding protein [Candidatus Rokuibacteriota bacterium]
MMNARAKPEAPSVLTVGVDESPPPPLCFGLPGTPQFRGFEVDLLEALASRLSVELRCRSALWSVALDELRGGRMDMICTAATITAERRRVVDFSDPYFESELALIVRRGEADRWPEGMAGKTVGVRVATTAEEFLRGQSLPVRVRTFDFNVDAYRALRGEEVDAVVDDHPIGSYFARSQDGLALGPRLAGTTFRYGLVFAKGNDGLRNRVNRALAEVRADGTLERIHQRWFGDTP